MSIYAKIRGGKTSATEADLTTIQSDFLSDDGGVVDVSGGDCEVTEKGTPDMSVDVAAGSGYIPLAAWSKNSREQKIGAFNNDATVNVSISSNASGNDRIDIVCAKWDTGASPNADGSNVVTFAVTEGTPAASPAVPATPNNQYKLAEVLVSNGTSSITNSDITDARATVKLQLEGTEVTATASELNITDGGDTTEKALNTQSKARAHKTSAQSIANNTWVKITLQVEDFDVGGDFDLANDKFDAPIDGFYLINAGISVRDVTAGAFCIVGIYINGSEYISNKAYVSVANDDPTAVASAVAELSAGDYVELYGYQSSTTGSETVPAETARVYLGVVLLSV